MNQVTEVYSFVKQLLLLYSLQPSSQRIRLLAYSSEPLIGIGRSLPNLNPDERQFSLKKLKSYFFCDRSKHFYTLQDSGYALDGIINLAKYIYYCQHFHVNKGIYGVRRAKLTLSYLDLVVFFGFVESAPELANGAELLGPFFFVKPHFTSTYSSQGFELVDNVQTVEPLHTSIDI